MISHLAIFTSSLVIIMAFTASGQGVSTERLESRDIVIRTSVKFYYQKHCKAQIDWKHPTGQEIEADELENLQGPNRCNPKCKDLNFTPRSGYILGTIEDDLKKTTCYISKHTCNDTNPSDPLAYDFFVKGLARCINFDVSARQYYSPSSFVCYTC